MAKAWEKGSAIKKSTHGLLESDEETEDRRKLCILVICIDLLSAVASEFRIGLELPQLGVGVCP